MRCIKRHQYSFLAYAVLVMATLTVTERLCANQSSGVSTATEPELKQVFPPLSKDELSKLERPKLRLELLKMVSEDQVARSAGT